jgi:hypothetical protein
MKTERGRLVQPALDGLGNPDGQLRSVFHICAPHESDPPVAGRTLLFGQGTQPLSSQYARIRV